MFILENNSTTTQNTWSRFLFKNITPASTVLMWNFSFRDTYIEIIDGVLQDKLYVGLYYLFWSSSDVYTWRNSFLQRLLTKRCQEVRAVYILLSWRCSIYIVEMVSWRHFGVYLTSLPNQCVIHWAGKICIVGMFFSVIHSFMTVLNKF